MPHQGSTSIGGVGFFGAGFSASGAPRGGPVQGGPVQGGPPRGAPEERSADHDAAGDPDAAHLPRGGSAAKRRRVEGALHGAAGGAEGPLPGLGGATAIPISASALEWLGPLRGGFLLERFVQEGRERGAREPRGHAGAAGGAGGARGEK